KSLEKTAQKLSLELARRDGQELYQRTEVGANGMRCVTHRGPMDDMLRARAQAFTANPGAVFLAVSDNSVLLAGSADSGMDGGARVKAAVAECGGRGGGSKTLAQGSAVDVEELIKLLGL